MQCMTDLQFWCRVGLGNFFVSSCFFWEYRRGGCRYQFWHLVGVKAAPWDSRIRPRVWGVGNHLDCYMEMVLHICMDHRSCTKHFAHEMLFLGHTCNTTDSLINARWKSSHGARHSERLLTGQAFTIRQWFDDVYSSLLQQISKVIWLIIQDSEDPQSHSTSCHGCLKILVCFRLNIHSVNIVVFPAEQRVVSRLDANHPHKGMRADFRDMFCWQDPQGSKCWQHWAGDLSWEEFFRNILQKLESHLHGCLGDNKWDFGKGLF